jgi:hypothetical protein
MALAQETPHSLGSWKKELGNYRAVIQITAKSEAVLVHIPWRRQDLHPELKDVIFVDATTGAKVEEVERLEVNREFGDFILVPPTAPGRYFAYYMPSITKGSPYFPEVSYQAPKKSTLSLSGAGIKLPQAQALELQSRGAFNEVSPMEIIATGRETARLLHAHPSEPYLLFPEDRHHAIRMRHDLPERWIGTGPSNSLHLPAQRGEFLSFQIGLWAARQPVKNVQVRFSKLVSSHGVAVPSNVLRCLNTGGTDWLGRKFSKVISVPEGDIQALWMGFDVPKSLPVGTYMGTVTILAKDAKPRHVQLYFQVLSSIAKNGGDDNPKNLTRLKWLDSTIGLDDLVVKPFTALKVKGNVVSLLGRRVQFGATGLPKSIKSGETEILSRPIALVVDSANRSHPWKSLRTTTLHSAPGALTRETRWSTDSLSASCVTKLEADGYTNYRIAVSATKTTHVSDIRLEIPIRRDVATYLMGMGKEGGYRPAAWSWSWKDGFANNLVWIGSVQAGLQCKLKGPEEAWDLFKLSSTPDAWNNSGHGGCSISDQGDDTVLLKAYSGPRTLKAGQKLNFNFGLLITPVKPLDPAHWHQRYDHEFVSPEHAKANGATVINIHQGNDLNPFINYPFPKAQQMKAYVADAHSKGMKVKFYYTVRELSNRVAEMWPLRSLGTEVFTDGKGGGDSWLQEHLVDHYTPAWHTPLNDGEVDAAIATVGLSRWHNYYLEGLHWLVQNVGIDGLYLDGIGYDREIMKRVRKVMDRTRLGCLIDMHCGNSFQPQYGLNSPANQFMEHFPYISSLWLGEGYDYNRSPDYWLIEVSGIPFGLYGEMLQDNGNPWRGMVYGMTARYYSGANPKPIWQYWDQFGIDKAKMLGYWSPNCPVKTSDPNVLATAYVRNGKTLISLASWAPKAVTCKLSIDWKALGLNPDKVSIQAPGVDGFQRSTRFSDLDSISIEPGHGWMIEIANR